MAAAPKVIVKPPQLIKSLFSSYHSYQIDVQNQRITSDLVRHRYSEFTWLKKHLWTSCPGVPIPDLPPKDSHFLTANKNTTFIEMRRRGLEIYLQHLVDTPYLLNHPAVQAFLGMSGKKFEQQAKILDKKNTIDRLSDLTSQLQKQVDVCKANKETKVDEIDGGVEKLRPILDRLLKLLRNLPVLQVGRDNNLQELSKLYEEIIGVEQKCTDWPLARPDLRIFVREWLEAGAKMYPIVHFGARLQWELNYNVALQRSLDLKQLDTQIKSAAASLERVTKKKAESKIQEATHKLKVLQKLSGLAKEASTVEHFPRFWSSNEKSFNQDAHEIVSAQLVYAQQMADLWGRAMAKIRVEQPSKGVPANVVKFLLAPMETEDSAGFDSQPPAYGVIAKDEDKSAIVSPQNNPEISYGSSRIDAVAPLFEETQPAYVEHAETNEVGGADDAVIASTVTSTGNPFEKVSFDASAPAE